jgi:Skp family chaperone for outer membrane proteins
MRKHILTFIFAIIFTCLCNAQGGKTIRIGYIDMEYILQSVPDYAEANNQLDQKAQKWKQEIELKNNEITKLKESLKIEKVLLTKELLDEREEAIRFLESEMSDLQQKHFGPKGDLIVQKAVLVKPIQDQVFNAVQDIAEKRKYDFILDKSSDLTVLFAAKRFDVSDLVLRTITRSSKKDQRSKKEIKADDIKEYQEDIEDANPALAERKKLLADKKAAKDKMVADRKVAAEEKKNLNAEKRQALLDEKAGKKTVSKTEKNTVETTEKDPETTNKDPEAANAKTPVAKLEAAIQNTADREAAKKALAEQKAKAIEDRKKALEEKKAKTLADREAIKKAKEDTKKKAN